MIRLLYITLFTIIFSLPVRAQDQAALCRLRVKHIPAADVVYTPDKSGVPADISPVLNVIPDVIRIPITVDLAQQLNQHLPVGTEMKAAAGLAEIHKDGSVIYNGQDVTAETAVLCGDVPPAKAPAPKLESKPKPKEEIIWGEGY